MSLSFVTLSRLLILDLSTLSINFLYCVCIGVEESVLWRGIHRGSV